MDLTIGAHKSIRSNKICGIVDFFRSLFGKAIGHKAISGTGKVHESMGVGSMRFFRQFFYLISILKIVPGEAEFRQDIYICRFTVHEFYCTVEIELKITKTTVPLHYGGFHKILQSSYLKKYLLYNPPQTKNPTIVGLIVLLFIIYYANVSIGKYYLYALKSFFEFYF